MLTSLVFLQQVNLKISKNLTTNSQNWRRKSSYLLNYYMNFNEIFRKNVTCDNPSRGGPQKVGGGGGADWPFPSLLGLSWQRVSKQVSKTNKSDTRPKKVVLFPEIDRVKNFLSPNRPHMSNVYENIYFCSKKTHTNKKSSTSQDRI